jgi:uncharacterized protein YjbI with pentapeptide repeats
MWGLKMKVKILITVTLLTLISPIKAVLAENLEHTHQLFTTRECQNCDLSGAGLVLANLMGVDLRGANLAGANLSRANLTGANLSGANLSGTSLFGANLTGANLSGANLNGTDLREAFVTNANLNDTNLNSAYIIGIKGLPDNLNSYEDWYKLGIGEAKAGHYQNAIEYYNKALSIRSDLAAVYFARSMAYADLQDFEKAMLDAKRAELLFTQFGIAQGQDLSKKLQVEIVARQKPTEVKSSQPSFSDFVTSFGSVLLKLLF